MKIGVIIPSRLALRPDGQALWLEDALGSIRSQSCFFQHEWVIVVGVDQGVMYPEIPLPEAWFAMASSCGQSSAVNAAAREVLSCGVDVVTLLEDDDRWAPKKMEIQLASLDHAPFSSSSQRVVSESGQSLFQGDKAAVNDYPIPSGWVMHTDIWKRVGGFNEDFRYLVDTEWLGRLNQLGVKRRHFVEFRDAATTWRFKFSSYVSRHAEVVTTGLPMPLVTRTQNTLGGMATIARDPKVGAVADKEQSLILTKYGENPW